ncbi:uncharacterized protein C6orf203 homolog [Sitophilus oryzae]|uniref:Uncharacterized protein C6orf203 homolog n=1 Tax=Sitophilus oryzae TaxID=7048 RepID=A0A6J2XPA9_SITOR|nr:uncharacterized protein C6orf203 homolog [Sitophilus oryzae]
MFRSFRKLYNKTCLQQICILSRTQYNHTLILTTSHLLKQPSIRFNDIRFKSKGPKKQCGKSESESYEEDDDSEEVYQDKHTKVINISVTSLRVDGILKSGLGMARNKIETLFYESKIRVNGEKILKKSTMVREGDEIDLIKGPDLRNPNFVNIARLEILKITPKEETISVRMRRCKSLSVESYS